MFVYVCVHVCVRACMCVRACVCVVCSFGFVIMSDFVFTICRGTLFVSCFVSLSVSVCWF